MSKKPNRYTLWDFLDDYVWGPLNLFDRAERWLTALRFRDVGVRITIQRKDKGGGRSLSECSRLLKKYGVAIYGRGFDSQKMYFHVKKRQANFACYILGRHGYEVEGAPPNAHSYDIGAARQGEDMPAWDESSEGRGDWRTRDDDWAERRNRPRRKRIRSARRRSRRR